MLTHATLRRLCLAFVVLATLGFAAAHGSVSASASGSIAVSHSLFKAG
ncbi:MAG TPA: hypothetical protein VK446_01425 [Methylocystis sp.]|nr:hypothetical protein [Methylocystis sp.]